MRTILTALTSTCFISSVHLSRGPSPISLSVQEAWPVAAAITEYINAYFKGGQHNRSAWCYSLKKHPTKQILHVLSEPVEITGFILTRFSFSLQMSGEDHGRPHDVFPCRHHADFHSQPQRSCAQLQTGQHLEDRSLPAKSKAALQVIRSLVPWITAAFSDCMGSLPSCLFVCAVIRLRVTQTPETSGSTCRLCRSTCRERLKLTLRPRTTTLACSNIRSGFKIKTLQFWNFLLIWDILIRPVLIGPAFVSQLNSVICNGVNQNVLHIQHCFMLYFIGP